MTIDAYFQINSHIFGHTGHANPHRSLPRMLQQSGKLRQRKQANRLERGRDTSLSSPRSLTSSPATATTARQANNIETQVVVFMTSCPQCGAGMECLVRKWMADSWRTDACTGQYLLEQSHKHMVRLRHQVWPCLLNQTEKGELVRVRWQGCVSCSSSHTLSSALIAVCLIRCEPKDQQGEKLPPEAQCGAKEWKYSYLPLRQRYRKIQGISEALG